jgi:hypothetical protein
LREKGKDFIDLSEVEAVRERVEKALKENPNAKVIFADHGSEIELIGNDRRAVIDMENVGLLSGREYTFTLACLWGKTGGAEAYRKKCEAVYCYVDVVSFTSDAEEEFKIAFTEGFFLREEQGLGWKEVLQRVRELMTKLAEKLMGQGKLIAATCMQQDRDILRIYDSEPPAPTCKLRALTARIFGAVGWKIPRTTGLGIVLLLVGWGIVAHDFAHQVFELKGSALSLEGGYIGLALNLVGFILLTHQHFKWLKK